MSVIGTSALTLIVHWKEDGELQAFSCHTPLQSQDSGVEEIERSLLKVLGEVVEKVWEGQRQRLTEKCLLNPPPYPSGKATRAFPAAQNLCQ